MNYYSKEIDSIRDTEIGGFYWKGKFLVVPKNSRPIDEDAKEYYEETKTNG